MLIMKHLRLVLNFKFICALLWCKDVYVYLTKTRFEHMFPPQEQLSNQISGLIHSFQDVDGRKCD